MITKIIFLDFDGVINSQSYFTSGRADKSTFRSLVDSELVARLNELVTNTGAKVVVSSSWRIGKTVDDLQEILNHAGFIGQVIGVTPEMRTGEFGDSILRGNEILAWIKENRAIIGADYHDYRHYVILDDDSDMLYWQRNNYIKVDPYVGLTPSIVYQATRLLNS